MRQSVDTKEHSKKQPSLNREWKVLNPLCWMYQKIRAPLKSLLAFSLVHRGGLTAQELKQGPLSKDQEVGRLFYTQGPKVGQTWDQWMSEVPEQWLLDIKMLENKSRMPIASTKEALVWFSSMLTYALLYTATLMLFTVRCILGVGRFCCKFISGIFIILGGMALQFWFKSRPHPLWRRLEGLKVRVFCHWVWHQVKKENSVQERCARDAQESWQGGSFKRDYQKAFDVFFGEWRDDFKWLITIYKGVPHNDVLRYLNHWAMTHHIESQIEIPAWYRVFKALFKKMLELIYYFQSSDYYFKKSPEIKNDQGLFAKGNRLLYSSLHYVEKGLKNSISAIAIILISLPLTVVALCVALIGFLSLVLTHGIFGWLFQVISHAILIQQVKATWHQLHHINRLMKNHNLERLKHQYIMLKKYQIFKENTAAFYAEGVKIVKARDEALKATQRSWGALGGGSKELMIEAIRGEGMTQRMNRIHDHLLGDGHQFFPDHDFVADVSFWVDDNGVKDIELERGISSEWLWHHIKNSKPKGLCHPLILPELSKWLSDTKDGDGWLNVGQRTQSFEDALSMMSEDEKKAWSFELSGLRAPPKDTFSISQQAVRNLSTDAWVQSLWQRQKEALNLDHWPEAQRNALLMSLIALGTKIECYRQSQLATKKDVFEKVSQLLAAYKDHADPTVNVLKLLEKSKKECHAFSNDILFSMLLKTAQCDMAGCLLSEDQVFSLLTPFKEVLSLWSLEEMAQKKNLFDLQSKHLRPSQALCFLSQIHAICVIRSNENVLTLFFEGVRASTEAKIISEAIDSLKTSPTSTPALISENSLPRKRTLRV